MAILGILGFLFGYQWQPETQVRRVQMALIQAGEGSNERALEKLISPTYADPWGLNRAQLIQAFREVRGQFLVLQVIPSDVEIRIDPSSGTAKLSSKIEFQGNGPYASVIKSEVNALTTPWIFTWQKEGGMPWKWKLTRLENPGLPTLKGYRPGDVGGMLDSL